MKRFTAAASWGALLCLLFLPPAVFGESPWPGAEWLRSTPAAAGLAEGELHKAREYALSGGGSGYITRGGRLVLSWGDPTERYDLKSTTKSIGFTALGLAWKDGNLSLDDKARNCQPGFGVPPESNRATGWLDEITLRHLASHTAGFAKPGGYTALQFAPGTKWAYSDGGPNWLAECVTLTYRQDIESLLFERVFRHLDISREDLQWRKNAYRPHQINGIPRREFGSGVHANVDAMARIGYLYLRQGRWKDQQLIPQAFVEAVRQPDPTAVGLPVVREEAYPEASDRYGLLWWNNADGALENVPRDAYWSWGLHDSLIVVVPSLDIVVSRAGEGWGEGFAADYARLRPFLEPIANAVKAGSPLSKPGAPYPPSPAIQGTTWAPASTIQRAADGSDNWPLTWADDGNLYTAYGDGWGFEPKVEKKLSLGFAKILGGPSGFHGVNIRSPNGEQVGQGPEGKKASGMLMVDGVLYMWVRNAKNSQLAWSHDYAKTWEWSEWRFTTSFGHPTFLNFGRNYENARDEYVYVYSHDHESAYEPADRMVLARVPSGRMREREAYEFFAGSNAEGKPTWSSNMGEREAAFHHPGRCYRSSVSYNRGLQRYLWCQIIPGEDTRFEGGFGIYDAPEPWGPWTTVSFTETWDVGPGENCHLPTKWMSEDGKTVWLVFSGEDAFSVRRGVLEVTQPPEK